MGEEKDEKKSFWKKIGIAIGTFFAGLLAILLGTSIRSNRKRDGSVGDKLKEAERNCKDLRDTVGRAEESISRAEEAVNNAEESVRRAEDRTGECIESAESIEETARRIEETLERSQSAVGDTGDTIEQCEDILADIRKRGPKREN